MCWVVLDAATVRALEIVKGGGVFAPAVLASAPRAVAAMPRPAPSSLTERQREVLRLLSAGRPTKSIARELGVAVGTVKVQLAAIYRALGATNRVEALVKAGGLPPLPAIGGMLMRATLPDGGAWAVACKAQRRHTVGVPHDKEAGAVTVLEWNPVAAVVDAPWRTGPASSAGVASC